MEADVLDAVAEDIKVIRGAKVAAQVAENSLKINNGINEKRTLSYSQSVCFLFIFRNKIFIKG